MVFGITLTVFNSKFFHQELNIYTEFIPQMIFMCGLFGYLAFLIIFKWLCNWSDRTPPGILNTLIFMFLKPGTVAPEDEFYAGQVCSECARGGNILLFTPYCSLQGTVQAILVLLALISIPWMLISKPYLLYKAHKKTVAAGYGEVGNDSPVGEVLHTPEENHGGGGGGGGGHGHGEVTRRDRL